MIVSACVRFYTKPVNKTDTIESAMYDIPCHRHADAFYIISQFVDASKIDKSRTEQGFLTHEDQFLNRYDAMQHAIACGQLIPPDADKELYSEDLW
jgi:hypothetical protein